MFKSSNTTLHTSWITFGVIQFCCPLPLQFCFIHFWLLYKYTHSGGRSFVESVCCINTNNRFYLSKYF